MTNDPASLSAQALQNELAAIHQTALDYVESWYEGDEHRMEHCLHPDLAKRTLQRDPIRPFDRLEPISALALVIATRRGAGRHTPEEQQRKDITILDVFENIASVKVVSTEMVDYLHLAKFDEKWLIVNALWIRKPSI